MKRLTVSTWFAFGLLAALSLGCGGGGGAAQEPPQPVTYVLTASAGPHGTVAPAGNVTVAEGANQTFTFTPDAGYALATLTVDGAAVTPAASYTFTSVRAAHSLAATFQALDGQVWGDEFDGAAIDTRKWAFDLGNGASNPALYGWGNGEMEAYTSNADNVALENGCLVITARRQAWGGQPFTSARLVTRGKFAFNQGRFVARIKMPEGNRMWPAFWLLGDRGEAWPKSGEIDIAEMFCGAVGRGDNAVFATAHWWDDVLGQHALDGRTWTAPAKLSADFHVYELVWTATTLTGRIDGTDYWTLDLSDPSKAELRDNFYYMVLNLAVGSPDFGMTSPDQADGPLPQKMYVDYVRVYATPGATVEDKAATRPHGELGILADGTACASSLALGTDHNLYLWNNLTETTGTPAAGPTSIAVKANDGTWFGLGLAATRRRNLLNYAAGYLNVSIRTTCRATFKLGISGGNDGEGWVSFPANADPYGMARDGQWHRISIPMTRFASVDFSDITQFFMAASDGGVPGAVFEFDEITWSEAVPEHQKTITGTRFGVATERTCDGGAFDATTEGEVQVWNQANGALVAGTPFEGASAFQVNAAAPVWYGFGFAPARIYDLSAYRNGHLHVALKVPVNTITDFKLGLKSPGGPNVRESWIKFKNGSDPYGFVRDGQYHELMIPMADLCNSDFDHVCQLFMLAGDGPATLTFDDVYFTVD